MRPQAAVALLIVLPSLGYAPDLWAQTVPVTVQYARYGDADVFIAGNINDWNASNESFRLVDGDGDGIYQVTFEAPLSMGVLEYRIVIDGSWRNDPGNPHTSGDPWHNSVIELTDPMITYLLPRDGREGVHLPEISATIDHSPAMSVTIGSLRINGEPVEDPMSLYDATRRMLVYDAEEKLKSGENVVELQILHDGGNTVRTTAFMYRPVGTASSEPYVELIGTASGSTVAATANGTSPTGSPLSYSWDQSPSNPARITFSATAGQTATITVPDADGEYQFSATATDSEGRSFTARRIVTRSGNDLIWHTVDHHAAWINEMRLYEVDAWNYAEGGDTFNHIVDKLPSLVDLGINAIWFTPITTGDGLGYWVYDYYQIEPFIGSKESFSRLVEAAHDVGIKVIVDIVFNHTGMQNPIFLDVLRRNEESRFASFHRWDGRPGASDFEHLLDWTNLPNLNVADPVVQDYLIDVAEYWVTTFDVDGFRADVAWGVEQRSSSFWPELAKRLKNIKPDLFLLGEGPADPPPGSLEDTPSPRHDKTILFDDRFAAAYDWRLRTWSETTGLPGVLTGAADLDHLHEIVSEPYPERALPLRFIENHDHERAAALYGLERSKLAHALILTLPGIPLIHGGGETGQTERYAGPGSDPHNARPYFSKLLKSRAAHIRNDAALIRLPNDQSGEVYSYATITDSTVVLSVLNFGDASAAVGIDLTPLPVPLDSDAVFVDALTNEPLQFGTSRTEFATMLDGFGARVFVPSSGGPADVNMVENGGFETNLVGWTVYVDPAAEAEVTAEFGQAVVTIQSAGDANWNIQLIQSGLELKKGKHYQITFDAASAGPRYLDVALGEDGGEYADYGRRTFQLATGSTGHAYTFTMPADTDPRARLVFEMGTSDVNLALDNVVLKETDNGPPSLSTAIDEMNLTTASPTQIVDLATVFVDAEGDKLTYATWSEDAEVATATVSGTRLEVTGKHPGTSTVSVEAVDIGGGVAKAVFDVVVVSGVGIERAGRSIPTAFALGSSYPNPLRTETRITYDLPAPSLVRLQVFDLHGRVVAVLADARQPAGRYEVTWSPGNLPSGTYFGRFEADGFVDARKMVVLK